MKTPPNLVNFFLDGRFPLNGLDQKQMRALRRHADKTGRTVLDVIEQTIDQLIADIEAATDAEEKIIQFPRSRCPCHARLRSPSSQR
jgi:hypothetical protein